MWEKRCRNKQHQLQLILRGQLPPQSRHNDQFRIWWGSTGILIRTRLESVRNRWKQSSLFTCFCACACSGGHRKPPPLINFLGKTLICAILVLLYARILFIVWVCELRFMLTQREPCFLVSISPFFILKCWLCCAKYYNLFIKWLKCFIAFFLMWLIY